MLERFCEPSLYEGIRGDLEELFFIDCQNQSVQKARVRYILRTLRFFRFAFLRKGIKLKINFEPMLRNYLNITLRTFKKHKVYVFINVLGLAMGMAAGFIILQYVAFELGYDQFFEDKENIYRIQTNRYNNGELTTQWASGAAGAGFHIKENFPEVESYTTLKKSAAMFSVDRKYFKPKFAFYASENFFKTFGNSLTRGVDSLVLREPFTVVLSEEMAERLFSGENPVGKKIRQNDTNDFTVTGVFKDFPENSHMKFDLLYSYKTYINYSGEDTRTAIDWDGFLNYVKLKPGTNKEELEAKFPSMVSNLLEENERNADPLRIEFVLQPISDIHLTSNYRMEIKPNGNARTTYFLAVIGLFVLFIAWINYINLTTANSMKRAKEVGIRKVLGSFKKQLIGQFMFESAFINLIALLIAAFVAYFSIPLFNRYIGRSADFMMPEQTWFWAGIIVVFVSGIVLSGFYPSMILSSFKPVTILKGAFSRSSKGSSLRKGLVIFQYLASVILITGTYVVYQQLQFLKDQDLGINLDQTMVINAPIITSSDSAHTSRLNVFKSGLLSDASIAAVTTSTAIPGSSPEWNAGGIRLLQQTEEESNQYRVIGCDNQFFEFYGLEVIAGRGFDKSYGNEENNVLVNEASLATLGIQQMTDVLNKKMYFWGDTFNVVGVVKNYRQESPKSAYDGHIFRFSDWWNGYYSLKVQTSNISKTIAHIESNWRDVFGEQPLDFFFLDEHYERQYKSEMNFGSIFGLFSILAIVVACLGLFGLASFMTSIRVKEVSVRKVLGASFTDLWALMTRDFLILILIAIVISLPVSWWLMSRWLDNFANRINMSWQLFLIPAILLILISILTVSYHTIKTALLNPAESLKDE